MTFLRHLFPRRRARAALAQAVPTDLAPSDGPLSARQRHYLEDVPYLLPKDPLEDQRLNYQHHALYRTLSNHYLAPLSPESTRTMLDVGTGTGIWAFEMHALFPHALVVGVDVSLQSLPQPVPPTCVFVRANVLEGLPFPDGQFTYTHQRLLVAAIPARSWPGVVQELVRVTRPGGWIELVEASDVFQPAGPATRRLLQWLAESSRARGFEAEILRRLGELLQQAGCVEVSSLDISVPVGRWAGTTGQLLRTDLWHAFEALTEPVCAHLQLPPAVFETVLHEAAEEWEQLQARFVFHAAYGRRPQP
jgi:ubiquinone/menaquinone biosynthesis C-methylase UbiE